MNPEVKGCPYCLSTSVIRTTYETCQRNGGEYFCQSCKETFEFGAEKSEFYKSAMEEQINENKRIYEVIEDLSGTIDDLNAANDCLRNEVERYEEAAAEPV